MKRQSNEKFNFTVVATAIETLGLSLPFSSSSPAVSREKHQECQDVGVAIKKLLIDDIRPSAILTREAFENAMVGVLYGLF